MKLLAVVVFVVVELMLVSSQTTDFATITGTEMMSSAAMTTSAMTTSVMTTNQATTMGQKEWKVTNGTNVCILAMMDADIAVVYNKTDNTTGFVQLMLPETAMVNDSESMCGNGENEPAVLVLSWEKNSFRQEFSLKASSYSLTLVEANLYHDSTHFPDSADDGNTVTYSGSPPAMFFETTSNTSYKCNSMQSFDLGSNGNISYTNVKVQPFGIDSTGGFSPESECSADRSSTPMPTGSTPKPPLPPAGNWTVKNATGGICMNMTLRAEFTINYWNSTNKTASITDALPDDANADSSTCNDTVANFVLTFFTNWEMSMTFEMDSDKDDYKLKSYNLTYFLDSHFKNPAKPGEMLMASNTDTGIEAQVGRYYKCVSSSKLIAGNTTTMFSEMRLQPFVQEDDGSKGEKYNECVADSAISNIVPIAVGCALAGLVIIVLIAYLIGRSRSSRQGYQSV